MSNQSASEILSALKSNKNVLLYGPPGTGKTNLLSEIISQLQRESPKAPALKTGTGKGLFGTVQDKTTNHFISPIVEWVTFHQNYSYQDFIVGKRPKPEGGGMVLEPYFGKLMDNIFDLSASEEKKDFVLIIDEINRANVSKVFGEFITFLDPDYRETIDQQNNDRAVGINLAGIEYSYGKSENIKSLKTGSFVQLPESWKFPENVYVIATMNSVDKAAMPIDSAMLRRFHQVPIMPDIEILANKLGTNLTDIKSVASKIENGESTSESFTSAQIAVLILDRVNWFIAKHLGEDFEIGHSVFWHLKGNDEEMWEGLIDVWDNKLLPLIKNRLIKAQSVLISILKIEESAETTKAFYQRTTLSNREEVDESSALSYTPLKSLDIELAKKILRDIAF